MLRSPPSFITDKRESPSSGKLAKRIVRADELYEQAQYVAMKEYTPPRGTLAPASSDDDDEDPSKRGQQPRQTLTRERQTLHRRPADEVDLRRRDGVDDPRAAAEASPSQVRPELPLERQGSPPQQLQSTVTSDRDELTRIVRVKDEMIYQLLLERTELRKQKAAMEAYVNELSGVSTAEMKKWARLTDEMHAEIERLRSQLQQRGAL